MANLLATKPLNTILAEAHETGEHSLRRALGATNLITLGIGAIIGTGIFVITGTATAEHAGPAIILSFVVAALGCVFAGLCYAEFASMIPVAGSAYTYGYATLGEIFAWIIGWDLVLEYAFGAATVASGWSGYLISLLGDFGIKLPASLAGTRWDEFIFYKNHWEPVKLILPKLKEAGIDPASLPHAFGSFNLFGFLAIMLATVILVIGIKESANFNSAIVVIKVCVLIIFVAIGASFLMKNPHLTTANWHPFIPPNTGSFGQFGWSGILRAAGIIFFAYIGFDAVSTAAQEAKNPAKDMPIGILGSLIICTILYIVVAAVLTGLVPYHNLDVRDPLAVGIDSTGVRWGSLLVKIGALMGLSSTIVVMLLGQSRVFFSMSKDGLLPGLFSNVHVKFRTPWISSITVGTFVALLAASLPINVLDEMVSIGTLLAFVIVCAGVWLIRRRNPNLERPFKTPWVPFVPIMGILISLAMMLSLTGLTWIRLAVWLVVGMIIYFFYGRYHSRVQRGVLERAGDRVIG
ncbi:MAG TPA: amino acid permease [Candidatus Angelobacter sp.]|nr:amino acid permease [Candidatus Angelobacter sp.]